MNIQPIELIENYWILIDQDSEDEYQNKQGDNLVFDTRKQAERYIKNYITLEGESC